MQSEADTAEVGLAHAESLKRLATLLADPQGADDLVQSTWVRALEQGSAPVRSRGAWLRQILRNEHRMEIRARRRAQAREQAVPEGEPDDMERAAAQRQVAGIVAQLVEALEPDVRDVVQERYYDGHSAADIARMRKIPAGTVRWRLKLGIDRLREQLDARYGGQRAMWAGAFAPLSIPPTIGEAAASLGTTNAARAASNQGMSAMIAKLVIGCVVAATAGGAAAWKLGESREAGVDRDVVAPAPEPIAAVATAAGGTPAQRESVAIARQRWSQRRAEIRDAHARRQAAPAPAPAPAPGWHADPSAGEDCHRVGMCMDEACLGRLARQVAELVSSCEELVSAMPDDATLTAHILGAPDVGTIVESVQLGGSDTLPPELSECLTESMYALELEHEAADFEQDISVLLRAPGSSVAELLAGGEPVEVTKADIDALLGGLGMGELPASGTVYVMSADAPPE